LLDKAGHFGLDKSLWKDKVTSFPNVTKGINSEWINWEIFGYLCENETLYLS